MGQPINEHEYFPTQGEIAYFAGLRMSWISRHQRFEAGAWDWQATVGICPDGKWKAMYIYDDGSVGAHGRTWVSGKFDDPIACYVHAKVENWGNP